MHPIISIVGKSDSGKTTLLEGLIAELKRRDYRVAVIKHSNEDYELDTANKDSWRLNRAGSDISAICLAHKIAVFKPLEHDFSPEDFSHFISWDYDIILTEGFKHCRYPKIEVHRTEQGSSLLSPVQQLLAVVTDAPLEVNVPQFSKDETLEIVNLIEKNMLNQNKKDNIDLMINGRPVPLGSPLRNLLTRTIIAMLSGLKGIPEVKSLHLSLRRKT